MKKIYLFQVIFYLITLHFSISLFSQDVQVYKQFDKKIRAGDSVGALGILDSAIKKNPKDYTLIGFRATCKYDMKDYKGALKDIERAIRLMPENIKLLIHRVYINSALGNYRKSINDINKVIEKDSGKFYYFVLKSKNHFDLREFEYSLTSINKAIKLNKNEHFLYSFRAMILIEYGGDTSSAINDYEKAYRLNPSEKFYLKQIAYLNFNQYNFDIAISNFKKYLQKVPKDTKTRRFHAIINAITGDISGVFNEIEEAYRIDSNKSEYIKSILSFKRLMGDLDTSLLLINNYLEINPENSDYIFERGRIKMSLKDTTGAIKDFNQAIRLDSSEYDRLVHKSEIMNYSRQYKSALKLLNKACRLNKANSIAYQLRSAVKAELKDSNGALSDIARAYMLSERSIISLSYIGEIKRILEDYIGAIKYFDYVLEKAPGLVNNYYYRGLAKLKLGDKEGACNDFIKAREGGYMGTDEEFDKNCK